MKDDLPQESADALMDSMRDVVRNIVGIEIDVYREMLPLRHQPLRLSQYVVTLPAGTTDEQRAEADYWLNEIGGIIIYK